MATYSGEVDLSVLTELIEKTKTLQGDGTVSFQGFAHTEHLAILNTFVRLNSEIPESEGRRLINKACFETAADGKVTAEALLKRINRLERTYLATRKKRFRLVTSISIGSLKNPIIVKTSDCHITYGWKSSQTAGTERAKKILDASRSINGHPPNNYAAVSCIVSARNPEEAATIALDQIDIFRSIWNLWLNRGLGIRISSGRRQPVNSFRLGPIHTVHLPSGRLATDEWWYDPNFTEPMRPWHQPQRIANMMLFTKRVRTSISKLPYRPQIEAALIRYSRALDLSDWNSSILQLWSILELLTGTTLGENHKVTVRRSAFLFRNHDYASLTLNHLRTYRNNAIHTGKESWQIETLVFQVKNFVETLLNFHLSRAGEFSSLADVAQFLDQPPGIEELDRQLKLLRNVRRFIA
ncbi:hypothetical protein BurJ1DRAFT_1834 [Burkholderiales bacterium JOSHI_001]|nr:hypothetical protein BurJ1DRAFT_1834 [Burkholderiales bacterium JOSHI_001]